MIKKTFIIACMLILVPLTGTTMAQAQEAGDIDENGWVWVNFTDNF